MADFINATGTLGVVFDALVVQMGSPYMVLFSIFIVLFIILLIFRVPVEFAALFLLPLTLVMWAHDASWLLMIGLSLIFVGIIVARNLPHQ